MNKPYYECHITLAASATSAQEAVETLQWKYSAIDGDPVLGKRVLQYATRHFKIEMPLDQVVLEMNRVAFYLKYTYGCNVLRQKVEQVVYDTKEPPRGTA